MRIAADHRDIVQLGEHLHDAQKVGGSSPPVPSLVFWQLVGVGFFIVFVLQSGRVGKRRRHVAFDIGSIPISATLGP